MRLAAYAGTSTLLAVGVLLKAFLERPNFYSATVYLSQSNACLMILANFLLMSFVGFMYELQRLLYGPLRPIEVEQLYDKSWFAVMETLLAMTVFRDEFGPWFVVMLVSLIAGKVWGWIGEGRVEVLEQQPPTNPLLFHTRLCASLFLSVCYDTLMLEYASRTVLEQPRPGMMVMFAFEFAVLTIGSTSTAARYAIYGRERMIVKQQTQIKLAQRKAEIRAATEAAEREAAAGNVSQSGANLPTEDNIDENDIDVPGWEEKGRWIFYLDLATDLCKLIIYMAFFVILLAFHGLPLHILRDVYLTFRSFVKRINDFIKYRNATRDMNARYPDATSEELERESTCIICREEMRPWQQDGPPVGPDGPAPQPHPTSEQRLRPKKLPCGHILHFGCLRSWLERQQMCPICRRSVLTPTTRGTGANQQGRDANNHQVPPGLRPNRHQNQAGAAPARRVFNFGPFRLVLGEGRAPQRRGQHQNQQIQAEGPERRTVVPPGSMTGRGSEHRGHRRSVDVQYRLLRIEQQIMQEMNILHLAEHQLTYVRALQDELERLRSAQAIYQAIPRARGPPFTGPTQILQAYGPQAQHPPVGAGHASLPPGMTLPEGWTVLPLQPLHSQPLNLSALPTGASANNSAITGSVNAPTTQVNQAGRLDSSINTASRLPQQNGTALPPYTAVPGTVPTGNPNNAASGRAPANTSRYPSMTPTSTAAPQTSSRTTHPPSPSSHTQIVYSPTPTSRPPQPPSPSSSMLPSWGTVPESSSGASSQNSISAGVPTESISQSSAVGSGATANGLAESPSSPQDKGKGKAAMVEDADSAD